MTFWTIFDNFQHFVLGCKLKPIQIVQCMILEHKLGVLNPNHSVQYGHMDTSLYNQWRWLQLLCENRTFFTYLETPKTWAFFWFLPTREAFALNLDTHAIELCAKSPCLWALV